jgi:cysteine desulfurase/selenocysteine lyase
VAVRTETKLDAHKLRADFPIFEQEIRGKPLAYLDSAASSQKPRHVLDALRTFYETSYANVHRGVYTLSERATAEYESAREKVARFVNAPETRELIFTHGATEAINLVAYAWGLDNLSTGDVVLVTELEHHSNFVPWQYIAKRTGADFRMLPLDEQGELRLDALDEVAGDGNVKVVANNLVSNALGTVNPIGWRRGPTSAARSSSLMLRRRPPTIRSTSRPSIATSLPSRRTRCAGRPASVRSGDAPSSWKRWRRSTSAAT